jgi:hypothetical protein
MSKSSINITHKTHKKTNFLKQSQLQPIHPTIHIQPKQILKTLSSNNYHVNNKFITKNFFGKFLNPKTLCVLVDFNEVKIANLGRVTCEHFDFEKNKNNKVKVRI